MDEISQEDREIQPERESDKVTEAIIRCIIKVHKTLGPGFAKDVYRNAMMLELKNTSYTAEAQKEIVIDYEGQPVGSHKLDVVVDNSVILEVKTVEKLEPVHYAQVRSSLRATGLKVGLLINFALERSDFRRVEL